MIQQLKVDSTPSIKPAEFHAYIRLISVDQARNRYRYYSLAWQPSLFGGGALIRSWGRIGTRGRSMEHRVQTRAEAQPLVDRLLRQRLQHDYTVIDSR